MADRKQENSRIDALYQWLSYDLQRMKSELMKELRLSSVQVGSLYQELKSDKDKSSSALAQEIRFSYKQNQTIYDGLAAMLTQEVGDRLNSLEEKISGLEHIQTILNEIAEVKYGCMQLQTAYESLTSIISDEVVSKIDAVSEKQNVLDQIENLLNEINAKLADGFMPSEEDYQKIAETVSETLADQNRQVLDAVAAIPVAENVDYSRIVDEVGDKVLDIMNEIKGQESAIDYDRIINGAAEKVIESLPYPEKIDYNRIEECIAKAAAPAIDYDHLADVIIAKMAASAEQTYDVVLDENGLDQIAAKVAEKLACDEEEEEATYDLVLDQEGINAIAKCVSEEICRNCAPCDVVDAEEVVVAEAVAEPVEEVVIEEEPVVEEAPVEEIAPVEEAPVVEEVKEEIAVAATEEFQIINDELVDAETGLVIRLKKSFTAKMKQSEESVKGYYSDLKNELTSYKRINSNVSWHGDRFNFGRDTVAKINICGKTLCFYLALDPNDPEYKNTVYHQKDVGAQKAYESTPFMVKVKSDAAAKKALRLVGYLAEKLGTEKEENFEAVNYVDEYAYQSTKQLYDEGFIKATKEKKVDLNF